MPDAADIADIILMGLRGSGKSTVARAVANQLRTVAIDLDDRTPGVLGASTVADAFARFGEAAFRRAEATALSELLDRKNHAAMIDGKACRVIALGGGTPTAPDAAKLIQSAVDLREAIVVYLRADAATLRSRLSTAENTGRPSLTGRGMLEEIEGLLNQRDDLYCGLASVVIEIAGLSVYEVRDRVIDEVKRA